MGSTRSSTGDLRVVMGSGDVRARGLAVQRQQRQHRRSHAALGAAGIPVRVSAHVPAVSGNKQNAVIRLGSRRDAVAPVWEGVTLIPDEITKVGGGADSG